MADEELKKKRKIRGGHKGYVTTTLEKEKALLDEFEPPLANQLKAYRIALTEKTQCPWSPGGRNSGFNDRKAHRR